MKAGTRRTAFLVGGFVVGLVAGLAVWWEPRGPRPSPAEPETSWSAVPAREPEIRVGVRVGDRSAEDGWTLMASEELARATPPDDVVDCRGLQEWALREGALPAGHATHTITLSANYSTTVESVRVEVSPDPAPYPKTGADGPRVRLTCLPRPDAQVPLPDPGAPLFAGYREPSMFDPAYRSLTLTEPHAIKPGSPADVEVVVDLRGSTGPFAYRFDISIVEGNESRVVPVDGGAPLFATEDGGGMGYWPATALWTMSPTRTHTYCDAVSDPAPGREPTCS